MNKQRFDFIRKRIPAIEPEIDKLKSEKAALIREVETTTPEDLEKIAELWSGRAPVTGKLIRIDYADWQILIRVGDFEYALVDVNHLKADTATRDLALALAQRFAVRDFHFHPDEVTVYPDGLVK